MPNLTENTPELLLIKSSNEPDKIYSDWQDIDGDYLSAETQIKLFESSINSVFSYQINCNITFSQWDENNTRASKCGVSFIWKYSHKITCYFIDINRSTLQSNFLEKKIVYNFTTPQAIDIFEWKVETGYNGKLGSGRYEKENIQSSNDIILNFKDLSFATYEIEFITLNSTYIIQNDVHWFNTSQNAFLIQSTIDCKRNLSQIDSDLENKQIYFQSEAIPKGENTNFGNEDRKYDITLNTSKITFVSWTYPSCGGGNYIPYIYAGDFEIGVNFVIKGDNVTYIFANHKLCQLPISIFSEPSFFIGIVVGMGISIAGLASFFIFKRKFSRNVSQ